MIDLICRQICGKETFEEIKSCKNCNRKNGIRICTNKKLCTLSLAFEHEKIFNEISEQEIVDAESLNNFNSIFYACDKCREDWIACEGRKKEECVDKIQMKKMLIEKIKEVCPEYLVEIEKYNYAKEVYEKYMDKIREIRKSKNKVIKKVYTLSKNDIGKLNKSEIDDFIKNKFSKHSGEK